MKTLPSFLQSNIEDKKLIGARLRTSALAGVFCLQFSKSM